jgi:hypothetical protein
MMNKEFFDSSGCSLCDDRRKLVLSENRCQIVFENPALKSICQVRIDGCLIQSGIRCDYLVLVPEKCEVFFIELKGHDFLQAIRQIDRSINVLNEHLDSTRINARIVLTKVNTPDLMNNPTLLKFEKKIRKLKGTLKKGTLKMIEKV